MRGQFRILIVDDEDTILRSIPSMLRDYSADIDTASDNNQALSRFQKAPYDLVSLDMNMPDFDGEPNPVAGINLLEKLREIDDTLPAIILTGEDEITIRSMLNAKNMKNVDVFLKNSPGADRELIGKVGKLLDECEVSIQAVGEAEPSLFSRKDIVSLQGVVSSLGSDREGHVFIEERDGYLPEIMGRHWLAQAAYSDLRAEPVDIIGVRDNSFVVVGSNSVLFLRDYYRNNILVHKRDLEGLVGEVVSVDERTNRNGIRITSSNAPEYLTSKKSWQAISENSELLPLQTQVDILGESGGRLIIKPHQISILNEHGQEVSISKAEINNLLGRVAEPIDEDECGAISIISEQASDIIKDGYWQAKSLDEMVYIPGEIVEVFEVRDKKLIVREHIAD